MNNNELFELNHKLNKTHAIAIDARKLAQNSQERLDKLEKSLRAFKDDVYDLVKGDQKLCIDTGLDLKKLEKKIDNLNEKHENQSKVSLDDYHKLKNAIQRLKEDIEENDDWCIEQFMELESEVNKLKLSIPSGPSSARTECPQRPYLHDSLTLLWQAFEKHQHSGSSGHDAADQNKPCTSRCSPSDSSQGTSHLSHKPSDQTSTLIESYEQLLFRILKTTWEQHGNSDLSGALFQALSFLSLTHARKYRVGLCEGHIHIQFHDDSHLKCVHSEIILHPNFRNSLSNESLYQ